MPDGESEYVEGLRKLLDKMEAHHEPYHCQVAGKSILVLPGVFSPEYAAETEFFAEVVSSVVGEGTLLEVGAGTGAISVIAALRGANVTATDISPEAVKNVEKNFAEHSVRGTVLQGNVFEPLSLGSRFDVVFFNHPFSDSKDVVGDSLSRTVFDPGYKTLRSYVAESSTFLSENGRLLLGTGDEANHEALRGIVSEYNLVPRVIADKKLPLFPGSDIQETVQVMEFIQISDNEDS